MENYFILPVDDNSLYMVLSIMTNAIQLSPASVDLGARIMYPDYASFLADALTLHDAARCKSSHRQDYDDNGWHGTIDFRSAVKLATGGWEFGAEMVAALSSAITSRVDGVLSESTMYLDTTTQYCWDIASAVAGVPQCGINFSPQADKKLVRIVVDFGASSSISSAVLMAKAATIASLIVALEHCNMDSEVVCTVNDGYPGQTIQCAFMLKQAGQALDINSMAFALGHPAFRRRIHFSWMEQYYVRSVYRAWIVDGTYGSPQRLVDLSGDITITNAYHGLDQWQDPKKAAEWVLDQLRQQGVQLNG